NPTIASIDAFTGVVTGGIPGTVIITYSQGGCPRTTTVTVNPTPALITGNTSVCLGLTTALSDATAGGTWSSSTTTVATIDPVTGVVYSVGVGTTTIVYTSATGGCYVTTIVTVNPLPAPITG